jgi:hypothetical protein
MDINDDIKTLDESLQFSGLSPDYSGGHSRDVCTKVRIQTVTPSNSYTNR